MLRVTVCFVLLFATVSSKFNFGRYTVRITGVEECEDPGSGEISYSVMKYNLSAGKSVFSANVTFDIPVDDEINGEVNVSRIRSGEPIPFIRFYEKSFCKFLSSRFPRIVVLLAKRLGLDPPNCYVPAGNYTINELDSDFPAIPYFPMLPYGDFQIIASALTGEPTQKIACVEVYGTVLRRRLFSKTKK